MARAKSQPFAFDAIAIEGVLISPAMLARIAARAADGQTEADYAIPKGLTVRDEVARFFRIGQALFRDAFGAGEPAIAKTASFTEEILRDVFGFTDVKRVASRTKDGRRFALTLEASGGRVPVVVVPPSEKLDQASQNLAADGRRRSAASALQEWLNADDGSLWGLACNGERLRLLRDNASLTRPAYIEANLRQVFEAEDFASFTALWLLIHASRFGAAGAPPADAALERWREAGAKEGLTARDRLRDGVEAALLVLGNGFLSNSANAELRNRVADNELPLPEFFAQLLRLVYRLIFLMVAEDRGLLHPPGASPQARRLYDEGYSLRSLRERAIRSTAWDRHGDKWDGLVVVFKALARGEAKLGLPGLAGLFSPEQTPDLDAAQLSNRALLEAIYRLAWLKEDAALVPVNWRDMETEELGSVYESLLELTPRLIDEGRGFAFAEGAETKGNARKKSGSYYTPDSLVQLLLDSALDPVLDRVEAEAKDQAAALLGVSVIDPACGSGHFLLAAARRIATRVARVRAGGVASAEDYRHALRDTVRACIYGVDRNPMAVELAKVALWIETVDPGKPLGFLDANIRCGDALFGVFDLSVLAKGIPDAAYKPLTGDDTETATHFKNLNRAERDGQGTLDFAQGGGKLPQAAPLASAARSLRTLPEDTPEEVAEKRRKFDAARGDAKRWSLKVAADLYVAAFLTPKNGGVPSNRNTATIPTTASVWQALAGETVYGPLQGRAMDLAEGARAFHWPLELPDVMAAGGFDVVLGNPPWEVVQLNEEEYFSESAPEIAVLVGDERKRAISALEDANPKAFLQYKHDKREFEAATEFARGSGRFSLTTRGKVNTYALFSELVASLTTDCGRAGIIVPTGIATDANSAPFFAALVADDGLVGLWSFDNRRAAFPAVHRDTSFSLLTTGKMHGAPAFANELLSVTDVNDSRRVYRLSADQMSRMNPNTRTVPVFRSNADADLTARIYSRVPALVHENRGPDGNPWSVSFLSMFNMSGDSKLFRTAAQLAAEGFVRDNIDWILSPRSPTESTKVSRKNEADCSTIVQSTEGRYIPLYEGKMIDFFDHRSGSFASCRARPPRGASLPATPQSLYEDAAYEPAPWYWVRERDVCAVLSSVGWTKRWTAGYRFGANPANDRTVRCAVIPRAGTPHVFPQLITSSEFKSAQVLCLVANLNSIATDYVCRQKMSRPGLDIFIVKQLPILPPESYSADEVSFIASRVVELSYTSWCMVPFARDLGFHGPPFAWDEDRRAQLRAELDAFYARAYGLARDELRYILDPADAMGEGYPSETFRVLKKNEISKYGEYRTAKLVLQAWDDMATGALK